MGSLVELTGRLARLALAALLLDERRVEADYAGEASAAAIGP